MTMGALGEAQADHVEHPAPTLDAEGLYRAFAPAVRGYLRAQGVADPDDVLGDVFVQVVRDLPRFEGEPDDARRWVFAIAHNRGVDHHRRRSRRPRAASDDAVLHMLPAPPERDESLDPELVAALAQLTQAQRTVVALRFIADLSLMEVASVVGREPNAVKTLQHRALRRLAALLDPS